jgi:hypothetical protein
MYLQEIYQSSNKEMFAISLSSCSRYNQSFHFEGNFLFEGNFDKMKTAGKFVAHAPDFH